MKEVTVMTNLTRDFVEKRLIALHKIPSSWMIEDFNVYGLDLRMCFISTLRYSFAWGDDSVPVLSVMPIVEQPSRIVKIDVSLNDIRILDDAALRWFKEVRFLNASVNRIDSFPGVGMLPRLVHLDLSYNYVSSLEDLQHCQNLVELRLNHNTLDSLRTLPLLPQLSVLNVDGNSLTNLDGVQGLPKLRELSARRNTIKNILAVTPCRSLESLDLNGNKVSDIEVVVATLQQMKHLHQLTLKDNPVANHPTYTRTMKALLKLQVLDGIAFLRDDGRPVDEKRPTSPSACDSSSPKEEEDVAGGGSGEMMYFRRAAREAYMDRIRQSRITMEEKVRHLQKQIITMIDGQQDFEQKMIQEMNSTLNHIEGMDRALMDTPRRRTPRLPYDSGNEVSDLPFPERPKRSEHKDPDDVLRLASLQLARDMRRRRKRDLDLKDVPLERGLW